MKRFIMIHVRVFIGCVSLLVSMAYCVTAQAISIKVVNDLCRNDYIANYQYISITIYDGKEIKRLCLYENAPVRLSMDSKSVKEIGYEISKRMNYALYPMYISNVTALCPNDMCEFKFNKLSDIQSFMRSDYAILLRDKKFDSVQMNIERWVQILQSMQSGDDNVQYWGDEDTYAYTILRDVSNTLSADDRRVARSDFDSIRAESTIRRMNIDNLLHVVRNIDGVDDSCKARIIRRCCLELNNWMGFVGRAYRSQVIPVGSIGTHGASWFNNSNKELLKLFFGDLESAIRLINSTIMKEFINSNIDSVIKCSINSGKLTVERVNSIIFEDYLPTPEDIDVHALGHLIFGMVRYSGR